MCSALSYKNVHCHFAFFWTLRSVKSSGSFGEVEMPGSVVVKLILDISQKQQHSVFQNPDPEYTK